MRLMLVRHGKAEDKTEWAHTGQSDAQRPLTSEGKKDFRKCLRGIMEIVEKMDGLGSSPYARAMETAEILASEYHLDIESLPEVAPPLKYKNVIRWIQNHAKEGHDVICLVGHEPDLGFLVGWLLIGEMKSFFEFKKGGVVMLDFPGAVDIAEARLLWYAPPALAKRLGKATQ